MSEAPPLRVRMLCHDLGGGGAARATARLLDALQSRQETLRLDLSVRTASGPSHPLAGNQTLPSGLARIGRRASHYIRNKADQLPSAHSDDVLRSRGDVWTGLGRETNCAPIDVVNLHWTGTGTLSIGEIGRLQPPVVMTLHDMWAFSGAEHVTFGTRYRSGYSKASRPLSDHGVDWDRLTWMSKSRHWRRPMHIVAPSKWLAGCARASSLMADWPITVIPHALDTNVWSPIDRLAARAELGLPSNATLVLVGADGGLGTKVKGGDLLESALRSLPAHLSDSAPEHRDIRLVAFGGEAPTSPTIGPFQFPVTHLGQIADDRRLRVAYSACDVMVVPSRLEAFGLVALEAQACGLPVVAFSAGGLADVIDDRSTGRLVEPYSAEALAEAIAWVTRNRQRTQDLGRAARSRVEALFSPGTVASMYAGVYRTAARGTTTQ